MNGDNEKVQPIIKQNDSTLPNLEDKQSKFDDVQMKINKLREERVAKHTARIEMLKKMNQEKYFGKSNTEFNKNNNQHPKQVTNSDIKNSTGKLSLANKTKESNMIQNNIIKVSTMNKNIPAPQKMTMNRKSIVPKTSSNKAPLIKSRPTTLTKPSTANSITKPKSLLSVSVDTNRKINMNKSVSFSAYKTLPIKSNQNSMAIGRHSIANVNNKNVIASMVDRLSKPKVIPKNSDIIQQNNNTAIIKPRNTYIKNVPKKHVRKSLYPLQPKEEETSSFKDNAHMRRSLSTVHIKRMGPEAAKKCMRRTISMGNMKHKEIEDELTEFPFKNYVLPVESERKKSVKFLTPLRKSNTPTLFLNTPKPSELKSRLNQWLQKRGKSLSSYHHLHCFGVHKISKPVEKENKDEELDENKENKEVYNDDSFEEITTGTIKDNAAEWRRASYVIEDSPIIHPLTDSDQGIVDKTQKADIVTSIGALNDLHQLISEGYSWKQCAEWLDAIVRHCGEGITKTATYWECRAALEDMRGDFSRAVECYNKAIMQGAQPAEVEESLDHLLQKFMELNLNPEKISTQPTHPKFLDVKNVFKSTLIRFAIQQKNIAESSSSSGSLINKYVATPVRRSSRLSCLPSSAKVETKVTRDPALHERNTTNKTTDSVKAMSTSKMSGRKHLMQLCSTLQTVDGEIRSNMVFVPNKALNFNDI